MKYTCKTTCTFGKPPQFYLAGETLDFSGPCPKHFTTGAQPLTDAPELPTLLVDVNKDIKNNRELDAANLAPTGKVTVESLARELEISPEAVKQATGKRAKTMNLSPDEVRLVRATLEA